MNAELAKKNAGRMDYISRNSLAYKLAVAAIENPNQKIRTHRIYRVSQKSHQGDVVRILKGSGIDHSTGNDAPKGGISGNFVKVI